MNLNVPLNQVSFGVVSIALLRAIFKTQTKVNVFPLGGVGLDAQNISQDFGQWLQDNINNAIFNFDRNDKTIKLWHINGALESIGREQELITFHETDTLTPHEIAILKNQKKVWVTANYTKDIFREQCINAEYLPLGFDHDNFKPLVKTTPEGVITFGLFGKLEHRKAHDKILKAWVKKYGNDRRYRLHAAIYNNFFHQDPKKCIEIMNHKLSEILNGQRYINVNVLPYVAKNADYNHVVNNIDIVIGCSRGEGRDLPVFHAVGLGKHCVGLNAHAYKDYLNNENAVLIEPTGMVTSEDGMFFRRGQPFNQGNFYDFNADDFISACELAIKRYNTQTVNQSGLALQNISYENDTLPTLVRG